MPARHLVVAALTCVFVAAPRPNAVLAQRDSSSATEEIKYRDLNFKLPRLGWRRAETEGWLTVTRTVSPDRFHTLLVVPVEVPREMQTRMIGQHSSAYFEMQRMQQRPPEDRWQEFSELVQKADSREFAAMTFTITRNATQAPPLVHGVSVLYFPSDFAQRQRFYCFMWMDQHPPSKVPTSEELAPLIVALTSVSPAPVPLVEAALSRLSDLQAGAASTSYNAASAKTAAARAVEATRHAQTYSSSVLATFDTLGIRWRIDFAAPDRYHVLQTAGPLYDEWITIGWDNYRSVVTQWLKRSMGEAELNNNFRVDRFLDVMTANEPISATESVSQQDKYTVLDYRVVPKTDFRAITKGLTGSLTKGMTGPAEVRIWIDKRTNLIAKAEMTVIVAAEGKKSKVHWQQVFTGYGVPIRIDPPANVMAAATLRR
jgi:hypothetical protein